MAAPYGGVYQAIHNMIETVLLETPMARAIARKGIARIPSGGSSGGSGPPLMPLGLDLLEQYAKVDQVPGDTHSQFGSVLPYSSATSQPFPRSGTRLMRFWDFRDVVSIKMLVTVTEVASAGSALELRIAQDVGTPGIFPQVPFTGGNPSVPLDTLGIHVTGWQNIEWFSESVDGRPAQLLPWLLNPGGTSGTLGVGLCQILVRGE